MLNLKLLKRNRFILVAVLIVVLAGVLCLGFSSFAEDEQSDTNNEKTASDSRVTAEEPTGTGGESWLEKQIAKGLTWIVIGLVTLVGKLLMLFVDQLIGIIVYNDFLNAKAVDIGWMVVRDLANLFFIVLMLLIAFGTLFKIQSYEYKKALPKLIIAVVLVNFSKTIVGWAIDIGQVIMLTFVNNFKEVASAAIVNGLGLTKMLKLGSVLEASGAAISHWSIFGASILALVMLIVACIVVLTFVIILLARIIILWILIIFSPIAFLASVIPTSPLQKIGFFGQYWAYLSKYIIIGPVLAFFLWLSFYILYDLQLETEDHLIALHRSEHGIIDENISSDKTPPQYVEYLASKMSSPQAMFDYMVTIALLIGALMVTQQMGVMGGSLGMNAVNKVKRASGKFLKNRGVGMGERADRGFVRAQKGLGIKNPRSLRPSKIKEARKLHKDELEKRAYVGVAEGRADKKNKRSGIKTRKKERAEEAYESERAKEMFGEEEYQDPNYLTNQIDKTLEGGEMHKRDNQIFVKEGLERLAKKDELPKFLKAQGKNNTSEGLEEVLKENFEEPEAAKIANRLKNIAVANKNSRYAGMTQVDTETGETEFTGPETRVKAIKEEISQKIPRRQAEDASVNLFSKDGYGGNGFDEQSKTAVLESLEGLDEQFSFVSTDVKAWLAQNLGDIDDEAENVKITPQQQDKIVNLKKQLERAGFVSQPSSGGGQQAEGGLENKIQQNKNEISDLKNKQAQAKAKKEEVLKDSNAMDPEYKKAQSDEVDYKRSAEKLEQENKALEDEQDISVNQPKQANQDISQLDQADFSNADKVSQAINNLEDKLNQALQDIDLDDPNVEFDFGKINNQINNSMKSFKDSVNDNIKDNQKKPNFDFMDSSGKLKEKKAQAAFLKQLKSLTSNMSQVIQGGK